MRIFNARTTSNKFLEMSPEEEEMEERDGEETRWGGNVIDSRRRLRRVEELQVFFLMKDEEEYL